MPRTERLAHLVALVVQLLSLYNIRPTLRQTNDRADAPRLVFVVNGHRYIMDITWPDQPLTAEEVARYLTAATTGGPRYVLLCMSGYVAQPDNHTTQPAPPTSSCWTRRTWRRWSVACSPPPT